MSDVPSFNIHEIERRRDVLVRNALQPRVGQAVQLNSLVAALRASLPADIPRDAVFESARYLAGETLTNHEALRIAWRLAGNLPALKAGRPVPPWSTQRVDEWVPLHVLRIIKTRNSRDKVGFEATCCVIAGSPCPMKISTFWSQRAVRMVAGQIGFSRPWGKYPFHRAADLVGLRLLGLLEAGRSRTRPEFHEISCPQSMINWNREHVLRLRLRVDGLRCPHGYIHKCWQCVVGYDQCYAGTHHRTYEIGQCPCCGNPDALFDPEETSPNCLDCLAQIRLRKRTN